MYRSGAFVLGWNFRLLFEDALQRPDVPINSDPQDLQMISGGCFGWHPPPVAGAKMHFFRHRLGERQRLGGSHSRAQVFCAGEFLALE